jgi:hypothetical protein
VIPTTLIYTGSTLFKLLQQMITLPRPSTSLFMKTSLLFENVSNDMSFKPSPSSSSEKPIYPHRVNHLLPFVPISDFMLLDNIFILIVWRSKAMKNRWWWWTTFGVRADDNFAENVFRGNFLSLGMRALYAQVIIIIYLDCKRHEVLLYNNTSYNLLSCFLLLCFFFINREW